ncbi:MAG TPA: excalibur calcium-binding domain-containing protein [Candidatus Nanopelagicales bacterium]|nr:excalibur calcium-binding domain-containing protein [Candidatus Nanopelagicales bacterium]
MSLLRSTGLPLVAATVVLLPILPAQAHEPPVERTSAVMPTTAVPARTTSSAVVERMSTRRLLQQLPVRRDHRAGYARSDYRHWITVRSSCDTRELVLIAESTIKARTGAGCQVRRGRWVSRYDGVVTRNPATFDVDHLVPLAEVNRSGGYRWNAATRRSYANDLGYKNTLIAVSAASNRSKGDKDPSAWMPAKGTCWYARTWVQVKYRWHLSVDRAEKKALRRYTRSCSGKLVVPPRADVSKRGSGGGSGNSGGGAADPRYTTCTEAKAHGYGPYYRGRDVEYGWYRDGDGDGIVCE